MKSQDTFLVPICFPMMSTWSLKNASSNCTICSKTCVSWGRCALNTSNQWRTVVSESFVSFSVCRTGICIVQDHRSIQNWTIGSFRFLSHVCERRENRHLQERHQYRPLPAITFLDLHSGQNTLLPKSVRLTNFLICGLLGIWLSVYMSIFYGFCDNSFGLPIALLLTLWY